MRDIVGLTLYFVFTLLVIKVLLAFWFEEERPKFIVELWLRIAGIRIARHFGNWRT